MILWLLDEGGARITETDLEGKSMWDFHKVHIRKVDHYAAELASLLRVLCLLGDAPLDFVNELLPQHALIATQGRQLRMHLPAYLEQQHAVLSDYSPLPAVLQTRVTAYAEPTHEDLWTDGLQRL
jgi:hypothetical protein